VLVHLDRNYDNSSNCMSKLIQYSVKLHVAHCYKKDYYMAEYDFILEKKLNSSVMPHNML